MNDFLPGCEARHNAAVQHAAIYQCLGPKWCTKFDKADIDIQLRPLHNTTPQCLAVRCIGHHLYVRSAPTSHTNSQQLGPKADTVTSAIQMPQSPAPCFAASSAASATAALILQLLLALLLILLLLLLLLQPLAQLQCIACRGLAQGQQRFLCLADTFCILCERHGQGQHGTWQLPAHVWGAVRRGLHPWQGQEDSRTAPSQHKKQDKMLLQPADVSTSQKEPDKQPCTPGQRRHSRRRRAGLRHTSTRHVVMQHVKYTMRWSLRQRQRSTARPKPHPLLVAELCLAACRSVSQRAATRMDRASRHTPLAPTLIDRRSSTPSIAMLRSKNLQTLTAIHQTQDCFPLAQQPHGGTQVAQLRQLPARRKHVGVHVLRHQPCADVQAFQLAGRCQGCNISGCAEGRGGSSC